MSDPRFARLQTDPRFRRPGRQQSKIVVDDRFKDIFADGKKTKNRSSTRRVDKYGRPLSDTHEQDNLRRFYRLENEDEDEPKAPDYARGEVLLESSDEDEGGASAGDDSDPGDIITLGKHASKPIPVSDEINLDEDNFADLDAQAAAYSRSHSDSQAVEGSRTRRLALVNIDWDHVRAIHLFKIFSSLVSPSAPLAVAQADEATSRRQRPTKGGPINVSRGKVLSVRVYPSEFGKARIEREEKEGPPAEVFKKRSETEDEEVNEQNIYEVGDENECDEDALRKYQLDRLRYYYAIVTCDSVDAAAHIYSELEGTELERSANVFDLSFVPDNMEFGDDFRDEATEDVDSNYKGVDFVTDALRHSKVKLTWDDDDPERNQITRRTLTKQEMEEANFKAYIASSTSGSDSDQPSATVKNKRAIARDRLRALLLQDGQDELPEGWGGDEGDPGDVDMEITFTPGLSESQGNREETTLDKYQHKMKEKRKKRKEEVKEKRETKPNDNDGPEDGLFETGENQSETEEPAGKHRKDKYKKRVGNHSLEQPLDEPTVRPVTTADELALLVASDNPNAEPKHFDLKSVLKAEKKAKGKGKKKKGKKAKDEDENELQEEFSIDVKDDRFKALHEDHTFAIDPSNPHFKRTKSMGALLEERQKRQRDIRGEEHNVLNVKADVGSDRNLQNLVESVKRKSLAASQAETRKRRKL